MTSDNSVLPDETNAMRRSSMTDGLESFLKMKLMPSMTDLPNFSRLQDGIRLRSEMADYRTNSNRGVGNQAIFGSVRGIMNRPEGPSDDLSDTYRSSVDVEHEMLCHRNTKRATMADAEFRTALNRMHDNGSSRQMMFPTGQDPHVNPFRFVHDTGNTYRSAEFLAEAPCDPYTYARCNRGVYGHHSSMTFERARMSNPPRLPTVPHLMTQTQNPEWLTADSQMHYTAGGGQLHRSIVVSRGDDDGRNWSVNHCLSPRGHLQPTKDVTHCHTQLSGQSYIYSELPLQSIAETEQRQLCRPSTKRRVHPKRENLPKKTTAILKEWLLSHLMMPYPVNQEKVALSLTTGLKIAQINNWFVNARGRIWKPLVRRVFDKYQTKLKTAAEESGDRKLSRRISQAYKGTVMGMLALLTSLPEARNALDRAAEESIYALKMR